MRVNTISDLLISRLLNGRKFKIVDIKSPITPIFFHVSSSRHCHSHFIELNGLDSYVYLIFFMANSNFYVIGK